MSFVTIDDFAARYENTVPAADVDRVSVLLSDACALAGDIVGTTYEDGDTVPGAIVTTICTAVRRAYENPTGLQGETIGDYTWRAAAAASSSGIHFTRDEAHVMRRAAGILSLKTLTLESYLPLPAADPRLSYLNEDGVLIVNMAEPEDW